jgi:hypothetical protein
MKGMPNENENSAISGIMAKIQKTTEKKTQINIAIAIDTTVKIIVEKSKTSAYIATLMDEAIEKITILIDAIERTIKKKSKTIAYIASAIDSKSKIYLRAIAALI